MKAKTPLPQIPIHNLCPKCEKAKIDPWSEKGMCFECGIIQWETCSVCDREFDSVAEDWTVDDDLNTICRRCQPKEDS